MMYYAVFIILSVCRSDCRTGKLSHNDWT